MSAKSRKPIITSIMSLVIALSLTLSGCSLGEAPGAGTSSPTPQRALTPTSAAVLPTTTVPVEAAASPAVDKLAATLTAIAARPTSSPLPTFSGTSTVASSEALAYLRYAVDYIRLNALYSDRVNWDAVERVVFGPGQKAQTTEDTYPSIRFVLQQLGDNHSHFLTPDQAKMEEATSAWAVGLMVTFGAGEVTYVDSGSPAERAGVKEGDVVRAINGTPLGEVGVSDFYSQLYGRSSVQLTLIREGETVPFEATIDCEELPALQLPQGRRLEGDLGYLALPGVGMDRVTSYYAFIAQQIVENIDQEPICGWIVDLQQNTGGNMWPMLAGVGPILGEGRVGVFEDRVGNTTPYSYANGKALYDTYEMAEVHPAYRLERQAPPVAVLTSRKTASAGEAILVAFRGRPDTRSFGEPSAGVPTGNISTRLSDGAGLILTTARDVDRTGRSYESAIAPDESVMVDWAVPGANSDPVLQAASKWLKTQPACAGKK